MQISDLFKQNSPSAALGARRLDADDVSLMLLLLSRSGRLQQG